MSLLVLESFLDEIIEVLKRSGFSNTKWYNLGLRLGLVKNTLDGIDAQYRGDFDRCLMECLSCWLNKELMLTSALRSMNQVAVADNVDQQNLRDRAVKLHMAVAQEVAKLKLNLAVAQEAKLELSINLQLKVKKYLFEKMQNIMKQLIKSKPSGDKPGSVNWNKDDVVIDSPSPQQCFEVVSNLIMIKEDIKHDTLRLFKSSPDSTLVLLSQLSLTGIRKLCIQHSLLNEDIICCISQCLINNQLEYLWFDSIHITSNELTVLTDAIKVNTSLKELCIVNQHVTKGDIDHIGEVLIVNETLASLELRCLDITDDEVKSLSNSLLHNSTLTELHLHSNECISTDGVQHLLKMLSKNVTIKLMKIDYKHMSSCQQFENYSNIKDRINYY